MTNDYYDNTVYNERLTIKNVMRRMLFVQNYEGITGQKCEKSVPFC